jgi:hypothetical protein
MKSVNDCTGRSLVNTISNPPSSSRHSMTCVSPRIWSAQEINAFTGSPPFSSKLLPISAPFIDLHVRPNTCSSWPKVSVVNKQPCLHILFNLGGNSSCSWMLVKPGLPTVGPARPTSMSNSAFEILSAVKSAVRSASRKSNVSGVVLFGSIVRERRGVVKITMRLLDALVRSMFTFSAQMVWGCNDEAVSTTTGAVWLKAPSR